MNYSDPFGLTPCWVIDPASCQTGSGIAAAVAAALDAPAQISASIGTRAPWLVKAAQFLSDAASVGMLTTGGGAAGGRVLLEMGKQGKHIPGHNNFIPGRSVFTHSNAQGLLDRFAGKGQRISGVVGGPGKERVDFGEVIGQVEVNGAMTNTTRGIIHHSKNGAHIVPGAP